MSLRTLGSHSAPAPILGAVPYPPLHCVLRAPVLPRETRSRTFWLLSIQVLPLLLAVPETENQAVELGRRGQGPSGGAVPTACPRAGGLLSACAYTLASLSACTAAGTTFHGCPQAKPKLLS